MAEKRVFTLSQVAQHKSKKDCWLVINGRVLNVTRFLDDHPGGEEVLLEVAGKDATKEFIDIGHSNAAQNMLANYQVGVLQGYAIKEDRGADSAPVEEPKKKEMSAFVVKGGHTPIYAAFLEFFVPLLVAGSVTDTYPTLPKWSNESGNLSLICITGTRIILHVSC